ncbi:hypothetical protein [Frankia gtarii]|uniref:hypothetical protein n=1 Tax=Frankia gtarii TaxID=2950102 RepID=UPI0021BF402E|nr:hypothetical protein [Frankia gtarii]
MDRLTSAGRRFPLVARPRPICAPLETRIREVSALAQYAAASTGPDAVTLAAEAHNKAALIASDVGLPDLARALCKRQFDVYQAAGPWDGQTARHALEPLVNLARLHIRDGHGERAHDLLDGLFRAVRDRGDTIIDGIPISGEQLAAPQEQHRELCRWLWAVLLADGTRALAAAGRWERAAAHADEHRGIGRRLLDGRQTTVLAHCAAGRLTATQTVLDESEMSEPWEHAVAACLTVLRHRSARRPADRAAALMIQNYLELLAEADFVVFQTRLGLSVIDLAGSVTSPTAHTVAARLAQEALTVGDGIAARSILDHEGCRAALSSGQRDELIAVVQSAGIGRGVIPASLRADLMAAVETSEAVTRRHLAHRPDGMLVRG